MAAFSTGSATIIAADSSGNTFVVEPAVPRVQKFDSSGSPVASLTTAGSGNGELNTPKGVAVDSSDNIYITDTGNSRVQKFNNSLVYQAQWGSYSATYANGQWAVLGWISIDANDNIWVNSYYTSPSITYTLQRFDTSGVWQEVIDNPIPGISANAPFTVLPEGGGFWISQFSPVYSYGIPGAISELSLQDGISNCNGLCTFDDLLFCVDSTANKILVFGYGGVLLGTFGESGTGNGQFTNPQGIVIDSSGNCWVIDSNNARVQKLSVAYLVAGLTASVDGTYDLQGNIQGGLTSTLDALAEISLPTPETPPGDGNVDHETPTENPTDKVGYTNIGENYHNVILPHVYGDLTENSDGGVWVCPCIDTVNFVYCAAAWPVLSVANGNVVSVYANGVLQSSGYTFDEDNDYELKGRIAIIDFTSAPAEPVTVRMMGKPTTDGGAVLMDSPVDIVEDWLDYCTWLLGRDSWEKDTNNFLQAANRALANNYTASGVIQQNSTIGYYLQNILNSFWGAFRFNAEGKVQLFFKSLVDETIPHARLDEHEAIELSVKKDITQVINHIIVNYAISYSQIDRRFKNGGDPSYFRTADEISGANTSSILLYGARSETLNFEWNRNTQSIENIQAALLAAFDEPEFIVTYFGQDFQFIPLEIGDQIQATLSLVRGDDNLIEEDVVYEIREKTTNLDDYTTSMILYSLNFLDLKDRLGGVYVGTEEVFIDTDKVYIWGGVL